MSEQRLFRVGDRVSTPRGKGTVVVIEPSGVFGYNIGVEHDVANSGMHNLNGRCENLRGWWYVDNGSDLEFLNSRDVVVIFDKQ